ncbi:Variable outer membrane protein [Borrelia duttonii CR2A]|uniref:Variable large protein n=1 Tax=Borrelia duttonii CR2A TaxID=1432657 RepID=W6TJX2_9SPIR|nr:Variable outer membrane protein [Borrelia duttonii CR2A]
MGLSGSGNIIIGNATAFRQDVLHEDFNSINILFSGIKVIIVVVLKEKECKAVSTKTDGEQYKTIGKLFEKRDNVGEAKAAVASAVVWF